MKKFDYYIGIDVSKLTLDVTMLRECENIAKTEHYKIENSKKSIAQFLKHKFGKYDAQQLLFLFRGSKILLHASGRLFKCV